MEHFLIIHSGSSFSCLSEHNIIVLNLLYEGTCELYTLITCFIIFIFYLFIFIFFIFFTIYSCVCCACVNHIS